MAHTRNPVVRSRRDTVVGWLLIAAAVALLAAGLAGLIWFPTPQDAGFVARIPLYFELVSGSVAVTVGRYGARMLRRRAAHESSTEDR